MAHYAMISLFMNYRWTWIWRTQWDQENWSVICKIRRIHMTNTWYASNWDQSYCPSYAKIRRTVVRHIQVHLYYHIWQIYCALSEPTYGSAAEHKIKWGDYIYFSVRTIPLWLADLGTNESHHGVFDWIHIANDSNMQVYCGNLTDYWRVTDTKYTRFWSIQVRDSLKNQQSKSIDINKTP